MSMLESLLSDLTRLGVQLEAHGDRLRYSRRSAVSPALAERIKDHKVELLASLVDLGTCEDCVVDFVATPTFDGFLNLDCPNCDRCFGCRPSSLKVAARLLSRAQTAYSRPNRFKQHIPAVEWPGAAADFVLLLLPDDLPEGLQFGRGGIGGIADRSKFLRWLQADVRRGLTGPRARYGALQNDLLRLRDVLTAECPSSEVIASA